MSACRSASALLAAVPLLVSCTATDLTSPPSAPRSRVAPVLQRQSAASGTGAIVDRTAAANLGFFSILDAESGIGFTVGLTSALADYCATGTFTATTNVVQTVATPSGKSQLLVQGRDAPIVVYDYTGGAPSLDPCDLVGRPVLATGTGSFNQAQTGFPPERYEARAHGTVTLVSGARAQLTGTEHYRARAGGPPEVRSVAKLTGAVAR